MINTSLAKPVPKKVEFKRASIEAPDNLLLSVEAHPKNGKTDFALTGPGPICVHDFDLGLLGPIQRHKDSGKEIYSFEYNVPFSATLPGAPTLSMLDQARKVWEEYVINFRASLEEMRTVVVDQASDAWNLCRLARLGKLTQVLPVQYTAVNAEFRQLIQLARTSKANVIFVHRLKAVYKNDQQTGEYERSGFGDMGYDVDAVIRMNRDESKKGSDQFSATIETSRLNTLEATGKSLTGADCCFTKVAQLLIPDSTEERWK